MQAPIILPNGEGDKLAAVGVEIIFKDRPLITTKTWRKFFTYWKVVSLSPWTGKPTCAERAIS